MYALHRRLCAQSYGEQGPSPSTRELTEPQDSVPHMTFPPPQGNRGPETPASWILVNIPTHASLNILMKSFSYIFNFYFYVEGVLPACISVCHTHTWDEEQDPEAGVTESVSCMWALGPWIPGPPGKQPVSLTTGPSHQHPRFIFC